MMISYCCSKLSWLCLFKWLLLLFLPNVAEATLDSGIETGNKHRAWKMWQKE